MKRLEKERQLEQERLAELRFQKQQEMLKKRMEEEKRLQSEKEVSYLEIIIKLKIFSLYNLAPSWAFLALSYFLFADCTSADSLLNFAAFMFIVMMQERLCCC